jgi:acyl-CoA thioesterase-1
MFKKCIIKIIILCLVAFGANAENKVVLFGDSLMAGYGLNKEDHLSTVLQKNLNNNGLDVKVVNASVSGDTTAGGLNRINWTLSESEKNIDILVLGLGANDMLRGIKPKETKENLEKIIKIIIDKNIKIILAGMIAPESHGKEYRDEFNIIYSNLSDKYSLTFLPFLLEGVALKPELNLEDGMHPNPKGIQIISKNIEKKITSLIN